VVAPSALTRLASLRLRLPDVSRGYRVDGPNGIDVSQCGSLEPAKQEPSMMSITMIGLDTAKSVFQVHGQLVAGFDGQCRDCYDGIGMIQERSAICCMLQ
jgi:hypothetical protein